MERSALSTLISIMAIVLSFRPPNLLGNLSPITPHNAAQIEKIIPSIGHFPSTGGVDWLPNQDQLIVISHANLLQYSPDATPYTSEILLEANNDIVEFSLSLDGDVAALATVTGEVFVFQTDTWDMTLTVQVSQERIRGLALSPSNSHLAVIGESSIEIWDLRSQQVVTIFSTDRYFTTDAVFVNEDLLFSAGADGIIHVWDLVLQLEYETLALQQGSPVNALSISRDRLLLASAHSSGVTLWDLSRPQRLADLNDSSNYPIRAVAFDPTGRLLASGGGNGTVMLWDTQTQTALGALIEYADEVTHLAFNTTGEYLVARSQNGVVHVTTVESSAQDSVLNLGYISDFAFSPDSRALAVAYSDGDIEFWNSQSGDKMLELATGNTSIRKITFDQNGVRFAVSGLLNSIDGFQSTVRIWHFDSLEPVLFTQHDRHISALAFRSSGEEFIIATPEGVEIWSIANQAKLEEFSFGEPFTGSVTFNNDSQLLARHERDGSIAIWDISAGIKAWTLGVHEGIHSLAFDLEDRKLASANILLDGYELAPQSSTVIIWDIETGEETVELPGWYNVIYNRAGSIIAFNNHIGNTSLWDVDTYNELIEIPTIQGSLLSFSPNDTLFVAMEDNGTLSLWGILSR